MYELTSEQDERIDWGKTAADYAKHRPGPPPSFYQRLLALGIGLPGQQVLDLATGTGVIARQFAEQGCQVMASDIAAGQVAMAKALAFAGYEHKFVFGEGGHTLRHGGSVFAESLRWFWPAQA